MVLGEVPEHGFVARESKPHAGGNQTVRLTRLVFANHGERNLPGLQMLQPFAAGDELAVGRENRRYADDVTRRNSRVAQCQLKARQPLAVFTYSLCEENFLS